MQAPRMQPHSPVCCCKGLTDTSVRLLEETLLMACHRHTGREQLGMQS